MKTLHAAYVKMNIPTAAVSLGKVKGLFCKCETCILSPPKEQEKFKDCIEKQVEAISKQLTEFKEEMIALKKADIPG